MSFLRAARAALTGQPRVLRMFPIVSVVIVIGIIALSGLFLSCGNSYSRSAPSHSAYVTLPATGNVLLLHINGTNGTITLGAATPQVLNTSPTGLALLPSKKFLYTVNSFANTISTYSVASDGTLSLLDATVQAGGSGPNAAVIDPSGKYLLVTNSLSASVSVFSIDPGTGALTLTQTPVFANANPSEILVLPSGNFVYVTNPGIRTVTIFSFSNGMLTQLPGLSPVVSGAGATGLALDPGGRFLYVANSSAVNGPPFTTTTGNISAFSIDQTSGALTPLLGSPFAETAGISPTQLAVDPSGKFLYATAPATAESIWAFTIDSSTGQLTAVSGAPFSLDAGAQFALFDPNGGFFYVGNSSGNAIDAYTYDPSTGALTAISGSPFSTGSAPGKMTFSE